ncbi:uncharacterized protein LOC143179242 [Calliopsis andreniformis]|uniref:uncharacterized protein LOC143179242 n=1 Tax=Calliopsis andreniformis TaxID=337506 RepID=UPI003FCE5F02
MSKDGGGEETGQERGGEGSKKDANADIYENRGGKKLIRLVTVMAYMFSVSFVAIVLSAYYIFLWEPPNPRLLKKPVQFSGEPEIEFLLGDPPIISNQSNELQSNSFVVNTIPKKLIGRIVDDPSETNNYGKLDESLFLLKNSLMEFVRNKNNDSKHDSLQMDGGTSNSSKDALFEKGRGLNLTKQSFEESTKVESSLKNDVKDKMIKKKTILSEVDEYKTLATLISPTIPENEVNMLVSTKYSTEENIPSSFQVDKRIVSNKNDIKLNRNTVKNASKSTENSTANTFKEEHANSATSTITNKFNITMTEKALAYRLLNNQANMNSSHNLKFISRLKFLQRSKVPPANLTNIAINFTETQTGRMMAKPMTIGNEQTEKSEIVTTQRQKDLLTILMETTEMSSSVSSITITEDFQTNPSTESQQVSTKTSIEST